MSGTVLEKRSSMKNCTHSGMHIGRRTIGVSRSIVPTPSQSVSAAQQPSPSGAARVLPSLLSSSASQLGESAIGGWELRIGSKW